MIEASKKYLPGMAVGYSSPKLTLHVGDGFEFMKRNQEAFDVIITDSSDPMGKEVLECPYIFMGNPVAVARVLYVSVIQRTKQIVFPFLRTRVFRGLGAGKGLLGG